MGVQRNYTVLVEIKDEPLRIIPLIENFEGIAKIIVLLDPEDSQTKEILIERSISFIIRPSNYCDLTQPQRTAWLLQQSPTRYVLISMASFHFPCKLLSLLEKIAREGKYDAIMHATRSWSHGKLVQEPWIRKRSSACYFFNREKISVDLARIHNEFPLHKNGNIYLAPPDSEYSIHVFRDDDMSLITLKMVRYAEREAKELLIKDPPVTLRILLSKTIKAFLLGYLRMGGFRSGIEGLIYHVNHAIQRYLVYSRLWELQRNKVYEENKIIHVAMRRKLIRIDRDLTNDI